MCGNPRPLLFITHGRKFISILGIREDGSVKHRYYYTFELNDLTASDCGTDVTFKVMGTQGEEFVTKKLQLDSMSSHFFLSYLFYMLNLELYPGMRLFQPLFSLVFLFYPLLKKSSH